MDLPKPTLGRVVWFVLPDGARRGELRAAVVSRVNPDTVNLRVLTDGPNDPHEPEWRGSVKLVQPEKDDELEPGTWHWMPYQLTKAGGNQS